MVCTATYLVHKPCFTGFRGARRDANKRVPDIEQPPIHVDMEESGNNDPCPEDEEFFHARPDTPTMEEAATMEEAIGKFMDGRHRNVMASSTFTNL